MANISEILNRKVEDTEAPKPLPQGSYHCVVKGHPEQGESSKKKTPFLKFALNILAPMDDVPADELEEYGEVKGKTIDAVYYTTDGALFMLRDFLESLGLDIDGKSYGVCIDESPNCEVIAYVKHEPSNDGKRFFARLSSTAKMEAA